MLSLFNLPVIPLSEVLSPAAENHESNSHSTNADHALSDSQSPPPVPTKLDPPPSPANRSANESALTRELSPQEEQQVRDMMQTIIKNIGASQDE